MTTAASWEAKSKWFFDVKRATSSRSPTTSPARRRHPRRRRPDPAQRPMRIAKALNHWCPEHPLQRPDHGPGRGLHPAPLRHALRVPQRRLQGHRLDEHHLPATPAGLPTYPAMTMAGSRIEDLPADQFNPLRGGVGEVAGRVRDARPHAGCRSTTTSGPSARPSKQYLIGHRAAWTSRRSVQPARGSRR